MKLAPSLAAAAFLALGGCSLSSEAWVHRGYVLAGLTKAEAKCATRGVVSQLGDEELMEIRGAIISGSIDDRFDDADSLLAWLEPRIPARSHQVLAHYATACRVPAA